MNSTSRSLGIGKAIVVGWLVVNVPIVVIMLASLIISVAIVPTLWWLFLLGGSLLGWRWWSRSVPRWRRWALRRGTDPDRLQRWAVITGLVWPRGSIFEKTEGGLDD